MVITLFDIERKKLVVRVDFRSEGFQHFHFDGDGAEYIRLSFEVENQSPLLHAHEESVGDRESLLVETMCLASGDLLEDLAMFGV